MTKPIRLGAVLYDPKVSVIWEIICEFFESNGIAMDAAFFDTYERQVQSLVQGELDMAWNTPLAWLDTQRRGGGAFKAIAMRDTDRDQKTHFVVRKDAGISRLADLRGKTIAMGALDSPQAYLIPIEHLRLAGLQRDKDYQVKRHDVLVGKHGDHIGGELDAFKELARGGAAATVMYDLNWKTWTADGNVNGNEFTILATTDLFDHCVFTVKPGFPADLEAKWLEVLFSMSYEDPKHRQMMDMEGLKAWLPGRTTGFGLLQDAVLHGGFFEGKQA